MASITQFLNSIKSLCEDFFYIQTNLEPLELLDQVPDSLQNKLSAPEFTEACDLLNASAISFHELLKPVVRSIKVAVKAAMAKNPGEPMIPYADFTVDKPPAIKEKFSQTMSFEQIRELRAGSGLQMIKPVVRRKELDFHGCCPYCEVPNEYIYLNNGKTQLKCKACSHTFTEKTIPSDGLYEACPYCQYKLQLHHDRKDYSVYVCPNKKCSYYLSNKAKMDNREYRELLTSSKQYRLHYHYRKFKFTLDDIMARANKYDDIPDLSRIHFDEQVLGLVLCYYVNYGLSSRKTALILKDIHGLKISHQTVMNYARNVSRIIKSMVDRYPYKLSNRQAGDETYVKVLGKNQYVFFRSDTEKKIITSYTIYGNRSTREAWQSFWTFFPSIRTVCLMTLSSPAMATLSIMWHRYSSHCRDTGLNSARSRGQEHGRDLQGVASSETDRRTA